MDDENWALTHALLNMSKIDSKALLVFIEPMCGYVDPTRVHS
jgi:hypothetical protein